MALSGSKTVAVGPNWSLILQWSATQNITNNTSFVEADLYWQGDYAVSSSQSKDVSITIDGSTVRGSATAGLSAGQKKLILSTQKTVSHNSAGDKNVAISGTFDMEVSLSGSYKPSATASGTWALNSIARKSSFTIGDIYLYYNESTTIGIQRASSAFTHTISYTIGSISRTVVSKTTSTSVSFTPNIADLAAFPNAKYGTATMKVETFNGTTSLGSVTKTFQIHAQNVDPTISNFSVSDLNSEIPLVVGSGYYVQGYSSLRFSASATGKYGATIKSYSITFNGQGSNTATWNYGVIGKAGVTTATVKVTDSRGFVTTDTLTVNVIAYSAPRISSFTTVRLASNPTTVRAAYSISISSLMVGTTNKNSPTVQLQYKPRTSATWTLFKNYTTTSGSAIDIPGMPEDTSYDFRILVADKLVAGIVSLSSISTSAVLMDMAQFGIGLGKMWERGALDVKGNSYLDGSTTITGELNAVGGGGNGFKMKAGSTNHTYMQFYARTLTPDARSGYFGYGQVGGDDLTLANEIGNLKVQASGMNWFFNADGTITRSKYTEANGGQVGTIYSSTNHVDPMMIQYRAGNITIANQSSINITWPMAFETTPEWVIVTGIESQSVAFNMTAYNVTATGCTIFGKHVDGNTSSFTTSFRAVACGRKT